MFCAICRVIDEHPAVKAIYPIHMNPVVRKVADEELGDCDRIHITEFIEVIGFQNSLANSYMILSDFVGIQEEVIYKNFKWFLENKENMKPCLKQIIHMVMDMPVKE